VNDQRKFESLKGKADLVAKQVHTSSVKLAYFRNTDNGFLVLIAEIFQRLDE